jgi:hypothetical protein
VPQEVFIARPRAERAIHGMKMEVRHDRYFLSAFLPTRLHCRQSMNQKIHRKIRRSSALRNFEKRFFSALGATDENSFLTLAHSKCA